MCFGVGEAAAAGTAASAGGGAAATGSGISLSTAAALASAAASAAAVAQQQRAVRQQTKAQAASVNAELMRQRGIQDEADKILEGTRNQLTPEAEKALRESSESRIYETVRPDATPSAAQFMATDQSAPTEVRSELARQMMRALSAANQTARSSAHLRGLGGANAEVNRLLGRSAQQLGFLGSASLGSSALMPSELQAQLFRGQGPRTAAGVLGGFSDLASLFAVTRPAAAPAAAPASPPPNLTDFPW